ncbi:MAG: tRNA uridine-5-carboxymethylaminomethyl(34) synthesis GTPase MnmE, partial [Acidobacteriaceae bacterium]
MGMDAMEQETIVAISTPVGRGGIGVVRLSGPRAQEIAAPLVHLRHPLAAGRAHFGELVDVNPTQAAMMPRHEWGTQCEGEPRVLDQVVVTFFAAPNSYTGEDVVEIAAHGSPVLLEYLVRQCCAGGARLAEPGEFTQRAFLAGRIDLTQAEAVNDLIASSTLEQARVAARQMSGALAKSVAPVKSELVGLIAELEAGIDFAEDDIDVMAADRIAEKIAGVRAPLVVLERSFAYGRVVREGFRLAIVGRPNAGKSSLFNRLVERDRAIVTAAPGTTRDTVTERVSMEGIPVELIDTAGLREGADEAERMGVARSREAMAEADVVLLVVDATVGISQEDCAVLQQAAAGGSATLVAWNKSDLVGKVRGLRFEVQGAESDVRAVRTIPTSALTGDGIDDLRAAIVEAVAGAEGGLREAAMLTNLRQHQAVEQALHGLEAAQCAVAAEIPHEMLLLDLYEALRGLDALTGATTTDDVLQLIFSRFCIG